MKKTNDFLQNVEAEITIKTGTLQALIYGSAYWLWKDNKLKPLDARKMGRKYDKADKDKIVNFVYKDKAEVNYKPEEILYLDFNQRSAESKFGISSLRRVLPIVKSMLYMEEKMPNIARRRGDPLLEITIDDPNPEEARKKADMIIHRQPGEDVYHGTGIEIKEVYTSGGIAARQTLSEILAYYRDQLVCGLGVPDVGLGFGESTTKATALFQEDILEAEVLSCQRDLKRFHEQRLFPKAGVQDVKLTFKPLKIEDMVQLSTKLQGEIEHGIVSPGFAATKQGYPAEAREDSVMKVDLVPTGIAQTPPEKAPPKEKKK